MLLQALTLFCPHFLLNVTCLAPPPTAVWPPPLQWHRANAWPATSTGCMWGSHPKACPSRWLGKLGRWMVSLPWCCAKLIRRIRQPWCVGSTSVALTKADAPPPASMVSFWSTRTLPVTCSLVTCNTAQAGLAKSLQEVEAYFRHEFCVNLNANEWFSAQVDVSYAIDIVDFVSANSCIWQQIGKIMLIFRFILYMHDLFATMWKQLIIRRSLRYLKFIDWNKCKISCISSTNFS